MNSGVNTLNQPIVRTRGRVMDYFELTKPELTFLSVLSALCGFYLGSTGSFHLWLFVHAAVGTSLLGAGAGALNQYIERDYDALMTRTERRPLPSRRLLPREVLVFGLLLSSAGIIELTAFTNTLTGFLGAVTWVTYLFLYTPLKRITPLSVYVGAVAGALPPLIGSTAIRNEITLNASILFAVLFFWQIPHFLSLAWIYKNDYARAGFKMLTLFDMHGKHTSRQIMIFTALLLPTTLLLPLLGFTGALYSFSAAVLGAAFLGVAYGFMQSTHARDISHQSVHGHARRMFFASLLYLPILMIVMSIDKT